ncbi:MAG: hypothetical protein IJI66_16130 [Erysipelotrichaceae bacterium]|nr:hypothetical protein [Erysipelotrichaceae bacterium]
MPRLTRTQKFADLRDSLANDREPSLSTKDLSDYENKLSNISDQLSNNETVKESVNKAPQTIKEETDPKYIWTSFQEPKTNPVDELVDTIRDREFEKTLTQTSTFNSIQEFPTEKTVDSLVEEFKVEDLGKDSNVAEKTANDEPMIKTKPVPNIDFMIDDILASNSSTYNTDSNVKEPRQVQAEPVQEVNPFLEDVMGTQQNSEPAVQETEEFEEEERQVVEDTPAEEISDNRAADHVDVFNDYIDQTINEVSAYNKRNGETTISDLTSNMVNEIRHHVEPQYTRPVVEEAVIEEPVIEEAIVEQENTVSDAEFSNTVSMEISKIMDEISTIEPSRENEVEYTYNEPEDPQQYIDAPDEIEEVDETDVVEEEYIEEHPVLAKAIEEEKEEEVVEIKNLKELEAEPVKQTGTISNTIPFVVATEEEDVVDEDDEDEGSNTILNIILVVLIIVLVAVLGLIIFYILKTKGII